jgi:UDPglucose 6-dehydrogenase
MKIGVYGLYHQGPVTAACLAAAGFKVLGIDRDAVTIENLRQGRAPLYEPGLNELIAEGLASGQLSFTTELSTFSDVDLLWVAFDTPVDDEDHADIDFVRDSITATFPYLRDSAVVLISAQLPVGSTRALEADFDRVAQRRVVSFASAPENLRLGRALETFRKPARLVVGVRDDRARSLIASVLTPFTDQVIWVSVEAAEMAKHALNAFLATSITFINEIAVLCEAVGADVTEVEEALRSEPRIGRKAYIRPGAAFAGGTLARDVRYLQDIAASREMRIPLLDSIVVSNELHRLWPQRQLAARLDGLKGKEVAILGLSYKPGTDSLRRSLAIELCRWLNREGALVRAYDPKVVRLTDDLRGIVQLTATAEAALAGADAAVLATEWPEFKELSPASTALMRGRLLIDQNRFLGEAFAADQRVHYVTLGTPS